MRTAKDGFLFDVDHLPDTEPTEDEVEVIQFLRPEGKRRRMIANVGKEIALMAKDMVLSAEELNIPGNLIVYARYQDEDEERERLELVESEPGKEDPTEMLKKVIQKKHRERQMLGKFKRARSLSGRKKHG